MSDSLQAQVYRNLVTEFPLKEGATAKEAKAYERAMRAKARRIALRLMRWANTDTEGMNGHA